MSLSAKLRDTAANIHSRGPDIASEHLREAATALEGVEILEADLAALRKAYTEASGGVTPTVQALVAAIHRGTTPAVDWPPCSLCGHKPSQTSDGKPCRGRCGLR